MTTADLVKSLKFPTPLNSKQVIEVAEQLRTWVNNRRRRSKSDLIRELGITRKRFYFFLKVANWSPKVKAFVKAKADVLGITALTRFAAGDFDARQLYSRVKKLVEYLSYRKRRLLEIAREAAQKLKQKVVKKPDLRKQHKVSYFDPNYSETVTVVTPAPKRLIMMLVEQMRVNAETVKLNGENIISFQQQQPRTCVR